MPRARDKVGGSPLGNLPGTPVSPNGAVGIDMEAMMSGKFVRTLPEGRVRILTHYGLCGPPHGGSVYLGFVLRAARFLENDAVFET